MTRKSYLIAQKVLEGAGEPEGQGEAGEGGRSPRGEKAKGKGSQQELWKIMVFLRLPLAAVYVIHQRGEKITRTSFWESNTGAR